MKNIKIKNKITYGILIIIGMISLSLFIPRKDRSVLFEVKKGETFSSISERLKEEKLIRSELIYKIYIRAKNYNHIEICEHTLNTNMSLKEVASSLSEPCTKNPNAVKITIPEGRKVEQIVKIIEEKTDNTYEEVINKINDREYLLNLIEKYEFLTEEILDDEIIYPLEGYLFPSTYELSDKNENVEKIMERILNHTEAIYNKHKSDIEASEFSFHQILTLASIVEHEAIQDEDRAKVASVFINRLENGMAFQSCATLGYAINEWKLIYSTKDTETDHVYNTYVYSGLTPGPGGSPGEKSILAVLNPEQTDYLFFQSDTCDTTNIKLYYAKTYDEHLEITEELRRVCR